MPTASQPEAPTEQKLPSLHDFFHPGGLLANSSLAFEHRPGQYLMAKTIEQCFADKRHLIVEAGTGTGKTLAYLLPALRRAREQKQRIIISTGTKNLQEQLYFKDIPFLETLLGPLGRRPDVDHQSSPRRDLGQGLGPHPVDAPTGPGEQFVGRRHGTSTPSR